MCHWVTGSVGYRFEVAGLLSIVNIQTNLLSTPITAGKIAISHFSITFQGHVSVCIYNNVKGYMSIKTDKSLPIFLYDITLGNKMSHMIWQFQLRCCCILLFINFFTQLTQL